MINPYLPMPMRLEEVIVETGDGSLKSLLLSFKKWEDGEKFFSRFRPGQFCQLSIFGKGEAPFGVASVDPKQGLVRFTINKIGVFTKAIHAMEPGGTLGMRGPLGNSYPVEERQGSNIVIVGGGYAFTTLYALIQYLTGGDNRHRFGDLTVLYGARHPDLFLYKRETSQWYMREDLGFHQTIDQPVEGWRHRVGLVPKVLRDIAPSAANAVAFICGPPIMIRFTLPELQELGFPPDRIFTSMEKRMKCGIGKCGRCNIGPRYICADGPVFSLAELKQLPGDL